MVEVPDVYEINGKWYLTMLTGTHYAGRFFGNDEDAIWCTTYAVADNPRGPFVDGDDNILIGGNAASGYTCRTVVKDEKRYLLYIDRSPGGSTLSMPKEIKVNEKGELGAYYADVLQNIRINTLISPQNMPEITDEMLLPTCMSRRTFGGVWKQEDTQYVGKTEPYDFQIINFGRGASSIEANAEFTICGVAAGFYVQSKDANRSKSYVFSIEPEKSRILLMTMPGFEVISSRTCKFEKGSRYFVKLIMIEGVCEVYIDNKLILQCGLEMYAETSLGLFCDRGEAIVNHLYLYELEQD